MSNDAPLLNQKDAARFLGLSARTLESWRWRGQGPAYVRIGRNRVRYHRRDLEAFLDRNRVPAAHE